MASRALTTALKNAFLAPVVSPIFLVEFDFEGGATRFWSGVGEITFDGDAFIGSGNLLGIDVIKESIGQKATGLNFSITGVPASLISLALTEDYQGRTAKLWIGALNSSGVLIVAPFLFFIGFMDVMSMSELGNIATFNIAAENKLIVLERPNVQYYTHERQQLDYPGDLGFALVTELQDKSLPWGIAGASPAQAVPNLVAPFGPQINSQLL